jgi:hypothetical protein
MADAFAAEPFVDETPEVDETPVDETPVDETPVDETPVDETPEVEPKIVEINGIPYNADHVATELDAWSKLKNLYSSNPQFRDEFDGLLQDADGVPRPTQANPMDELEYVDPSVKALFDAQQAQLEQMRQQSTMAQQAAQAALAAQGEARYGEWESALEGKWGALDPRTKAEIRQRADVLYSPAGYQLLAARGENPLESLLFQVAPDRILDQTRHAAAKKGAEVASKASRPAPTQSAAPREGVDPRKMSAADIRKATAALMENAAAEDSL